jgi:iron complex transport system substrate-binding protein
MDSLTNLRQTRHISHMIRIWKRIPITTGSHRNSRPVFVVIAATVLSSLAFAHPARAGGFPVTVKDARGVAVTLRSAPLRIISLTPGITEMLFAIGQGRHIVGDTVFCSYPPAARTITKIGDLTPNYEKVVSLKPDLIVIDKVASSTAAARLTQLHEPIFVVTPDNLNKVEYTLLDLGQITGSFRQAQKAVAAMQAKRQQAATIAIKDRSVHPKVLFVVQVAPLWTAGYKTYIGDCITQAGGTNIAGNLADYAEFSKEAVLSDPPDVIIFVNDSDRQAFRQDPLFRQLPAIRKNRTGIIGEEIERPGPRLADAVLEMARLIHGSPKK